LFVLPRFRGTIFFFLVTAGETQGETDTKGGAGGSSAASATPADPPDVLDREKCLEALAQLRHSKWFKVRLRFLTKSATYCTLSSPFFLHYVFPYLNYIVKINTWTNLNDEAAPETSTMECLQLSERWPVVVLLQMSTFLTTIKSSLHFSLHII
jgi:hypothetical protein